MAQQDKSAGSGPTPGSVVAKMTGNQAANDYSVSRYAQSRHWALRDPAGALVCVTLYRCGAEEALRHLRAARGAA